MGAGAQLSAKRNVSALIPTSIQLRHLLLQGIGAFTSEMRLTVPMTLLASIFYIKSTC